MRREVMLQNQSFNRYCQANWWGMCQPTATRHVGFLAIFLSNAARIFQSERERCFPSRWVHNNCNNQVALWLRWSIRSPKQLQQRPFLDFQLCKGWKLTCPSDFIRRVHPTFALTLSLLPEEWTHALLSVLPAPVHHVHANPQHSQKCRCQPSQPMTSVRQPAFLCIGPTTGQINSQCLLRNVDVSKGLNLAKALLPLVRTFLVADAAVWPVQTMLFLRRTNTCRGSCQSYHLMRAFLQSCSHESRVPNRGYTSRF